MSDFGPLAVDKARVRASFNRAADRYDEVAVLQREVASRMLERLEYVRLRPEVALDLGTGTGICSADLLKRYRKARVVALDLAEMMLPKVRRQGSWRRRPAAVCGDIERLPFRDGCADLIVSSLALQWCNGVERAFAEFRRVLRPGGLLMFTTFGPDTLKELRASWEAADGHSHVNLFLDMHDVGDALVAAGFADPVLDVERMTVTYPEVDGLMRDLKTLGAHNVTAGRARGLTGRQRLAAVRGAYEAYRAGDGLLPASHEVIYGHAWAPEPGVERTRVEAQFVPLDALRPQGR